MIVIVYCSSIRSTKATVTLPKNRLHMCSETESMKHLQTYHSVSLLFRSHAGYVSKKKSWKTCLSVFQIKIKEGCVWMSSSTPNVCPEGHNKRIQNILTPSPRNSKSRINTGFRAGPGQASVLSSTME